MRAEDIADVLGADADTVVRMCDVALSEVAGDIGLQGGDLDRTRALVAELPSESWPGAKTNGHNGAAAAGLNGGAVAANGRVTAAEAVTASAEPEAAEADAEPAAEHAEAEPEAAEADAEPAAQHAEAGPETVATAGPE